MTWHSQPPAPFSDAALAVVCPKTISNPTRGGRERAHTAEHSKSSSLSVPSDLPPSSQGYPPTQPSRPPRHPTLPALHSESAPQAGTELSGSLSEASLPGSRTGFPGLGLAQSYYLCRCWHWCHGGRGYSRLVGAVYRREHEHEL